MATFNVLDYGATPDDLTDDSAAIQRAIDAAYAAGGGTVYVPAGTYIISGDPDNPSEGCIEVRSNVTLTGEGMGATVLKLADGFNERINGMVRTPVDENAANVTISNLTIDGNRANNTGHQAGIITGVKENDDGLKHENITISGVEVKNCTAYGVNPHEITYNLVVEDCVSHDNGKDGFVADNVVGGVYRDNISYNNDRHGFNITTSSSDVVLENNISHDNGSAGLVVQRADIFPEGQNDIAWPTDITITGGEYYGNAREGILVKLSDSVTVTGASIHDNMRQGIRVEGATNTEITGNTIYNNSQEADAKYDEINIRLRVDDTVDPARIYYSENTEISDNLIYADSAVRSRYGIREEATNSTASNPSGTIVYENDVSGMRSGEIYVPPYSATAGNDILYGTTSGDTLAGLGGDDIYIVNHSGDVVVEAANVGHDTVIASLNHTLGANVEDLVLAGTAIRGTGNALDNIILGNAQANELEGLGGNDTLDGGAGADKMQGGDGNDTYYVDNVGDTIIEKDHSGAGGYDTVYSTVSYTLAAEVEKLVLQGEADLSATGNGLANTLIGNAGDNVLDGQGGADTMAGGAGDDTYVVDHTGDTVSENANEGTDTVLSALTYTLGANVENLTLTGVAARDGTGNGVANVLVGNAGVNKLHGMDGDDIIEGGLGADQLYGDGGNDTFVLRKGEFAGDVIEDFSGNGAALGDSILFTGFSAAAVLVNYGGGVFAVRDGSYEESFRIKIPAGAAAFELSDYSFEGRETETPPPPVNTAPVAAATGNSASGLEDTTVAGQVPAGSDADGDPLTYILIDGADGLTFNGDGTFSFVPAANVFGNFTFTYAVVDDEGAQSAAQLFTLSLAAVNDAPVAATTGNSASGNANTTISGVLPAGYDIEGNALTYVQVGALSNLSLSAAGGFSFTPASGASGDFTFQYKVVDSGGAESAVQTFTISVAPPPVPAGLTVTGTSGANTLYGGAGNDTINGLTGADTMYGYGGDDTYYVDSSKDRVIEAVGGGKDRVITTASFTLESGSEVEIVTATGTSAVTLKGNDFANSLTGNAAANTINGYGGADILDGGLGNDTLTGGDGADTFFFSTALGANNVDTIKDFKPVDDTIGLSKAIFAALDAGVLAAGGFVKGAQALDADDHILYDSASGKLLYDADGAGGSDAVVFAMIGKNLQIGAADFVVRDDLLV